MIEFSGVTRRYGQKTAVDQFSLRIEPGQLFALLGHNGAGKTTTIKMLVGLLRPDQGTVRVCGHNVVETPREAVLCMGYVPDEPYLYDKLTAREFLLFAGEIRGLDARTTRERVEREVERFELGSFLDELMETYSHGMRQRVVLSSALLHDPTVLIIDEPMVGLDPRSMRMVKDLLRQQANSGTTVFISTHTLTVAEEIADRIGILDHGRLRFLGTKQELQAEVCSTTTSLEQLFLDLTNGHAQEPGAVGMPSVAAAASKQ
ncbi:MAG: ABC transporter ATP-binding protein [Planctomycetota bacterium]